MDALQPLAAALRAGERDLAAYLAELEARFVAWEPVIFSFVPEPRRWARVAGEAAALLARFPDPMTRPPLFGVPVGVKDIFHVDGLPTRAGSSLPAAVLAGPEAVAVTRLRDAGALILGKTITTEFAWFGPGPARNPRNPFHTPGGSSSGSAAAVAAGLTPLALGSQTIGSVNRPAAYCGVFGFKPTYDRIPRDGVIELSASHDHVGFFAADLAGIALTASILCDAWRPVTDVPRPRLGVLTGAYLAQTDAIGRQHFDSVCHALTAAGFDLIEVDVLPDFAAVRRRHETLLAADAARYHAQFAAHHDRYHPRTRQLVVDGAAVSEADAAAARQAKIDVRQALSDAQKAHGIDCWLTPAAPGPAPAGHASTGDPGLNLPFTMAGVPSLTLPAGLSADHLPLAVQLGGRFGADEALLAMAKHVAAALPDYLE